MYFVFVAPGGTQIPPVGWGAVEIIIWDYYQCLTKLGHKVEIINTPDKHAIIQQVNSKPCDVVHIMYDDHIDIVDHLTGKRLVLYTTHWAYLTNEQVLQSSGYRRFFQTLLTCNNKPYIFALSEAIKDVYIKHGYPQDKIIVNGNGARFDLYQFTITPLHPDRSICIGKIESRKRQAKYQGIKGLYFVGNINDSLFNREVANYLGPWTKKQLYENLSHYGNLVLLSNGEADPLVVKEALVAGLGVVVSEVASANLDRLKGFITVIPDDKLDDLEYVQSAIDTNRQYSTAHRTEILLYAATNFNWDLIVQGYVNKIDGLIGRPVQVQVQ